MWYILLMLVGICARKNLFTLNKTLNQAKYINFMKTQDLVVCLGPAGTGKTLFACVEAVQQLKDKNIDKIVTSGFKPNEVKPAYANEPIKPAAPVPDPQPDKERFRS